MKKSTIVLIILTVILFVICLWQQIEMLAIADEINRLNEFAESQFEINDSVLNIIEMLIG